MLSFPALRNHEQIASLAAPTVTTTDTPELFPAFGGYDR